MSARRRHARARDGWLDARGITDPAERRARVPDRAPWSMAHLSYEGQAERAGRPLVALVAERLARGGVKVGDLPGVRAEAERLHAAALVL